MIRSSQIRALSVLTAMLLPVAAFAATGTTSAKSSSAAAPKPAATQATATKAHHPARTASKTKHTAVDINSASKEDLMKLPGITDETAQKIIDGRPYKSKVELSRKSVLTKAEYAKVRSHVVARQEKPTEAKSMTNPAPEGK
jgi:competence protein ComEA